MARLAIVLVLALSPLSAQANVRARRVVRRPPVAAAVYTPMLVQLLRRFALEARARTRS